MGNNLSLYLINGIIRDNMLLRQRRYIMIVNFSVSKFVDRKRYMDLEKRYG